MTRTMLYSLLIGVLAFALFLWLSHYVLARRSEHLPEVTVSFGETEIRAEIANSALARARGLSYRDSLEEGRGMLFMFGTAKRHSFWMQGMRFPIDIIWLRDGVVVDVTPRVNPQIGASVVSLRTYMPLVPADEVLEVPGGYAAAHGIQEGSRMVITRE